MKNLKSILLALSAVCTVTLVTSTPAFAAKLEVDCWTESGQDIEDGVFSVGLDTTAITKKNLIKILGDLSGRNLQPVGYPLVFGEQMYVYVRAVDFNVGAGALTRQELKDAAHAELESVLALGRGVSVACNPYSYPAPAIGVRN